MRNTITLNGIESSEIPGLLIQSLPPITKPLMRTEIEEIDGRDGDVITPLGFSAYDKQISIGLYGDFDIDEVISYFTSSGTVIFSNEPDKYYNYQVIEQIDFERLLRYRTATVTFHVQPFKYSTEEKARTFNVSSSANIFNASRVAQGTFQNPTAALSTRVHFIDTTSRPVGTAYTISILNSAFNIGTGILQTPTSTVPNDNTGWKDATYTVTTSAAGYIAANIKKADESNISPSDVSNSDFSIIANTPVTITNSGNYFARPQLTLYGSGTINLSLNGYQLFVIDLGETATNITIDTAAMEAYQGTPSTLMNRSVDGDYNNFKLNVGKNTISWSGNLTKIVINKYSRWI